MGTLPNRVPVHRARTRFTLGPFDLGLDPDAVTLVLGENGAGKSTLFEVLRTSPELAGARIAHLPQTFSLPPFCRVAGGGLFVAGRRLPGAGRAELKAEVDRVLRLVDLHDRRDARFRTLSGGMHRRAGIALSLIGTPDLVLLDEPTVGLDLTQRDEVCAVLRRVGEQTPVLMTSHVQDDVEALADRVVVLAQGQLVFDGTRDELARQADPGAQRPLVSGYRNVVATERRPA